VVRRLGAVRIAGDDPPPDFAGNVARGGNVSSITVFRWVPVAVLAISGGLPAYAGTLAQSSDGLNHERILGVIPDYGTVSDPARSTPPLTKKQKWLLFFEDSRDPFNVASAAVGAAFSQKGNQTPKYGEGSEAYGERLGAALADLTTQNFFSSAVLACVLHQDPRYFRKGPESGILARVGYSLSRLVVTRQDSGRETFNASGFFGMVVGIAASNLYYPPSSVGGTVMAGRLYTSLSSGVISNLTSEFWPDIRQKFFRNGFFHHKRAKPQTPAP
jgi:hypothetical protein